MAPRSDLNLLKDLLRYKEENSVVGKAALKSFLGHLWYLSESLIGLSFFDKLVSEATKKKMVEALSKNFRTEIRSLPRIKLTENQIRDIELFDLVSSKTRLFFETLDIDQSFLETPPSTWECNHHYLAGLKKIKNIRVVNDAAERGIALISEFNGSITNQPQQQQYLLQVVEQHRKEFPNANKAVVVKNKK